MSGIKSISIVSPVYNAEATLDELVERIINSIQNLCDDYELILVDDFSHDKSWHLLEKICSTNKFVKALKLSRNFGQHQAITAGLDLVSSDWIVVMDCDLQDIPEEIPKLCAKVEDGYEVILARRYQRKDNWLKRQSSLLFYKSLSMLSEVDYDPTIANFGLYSKNVISKIRDMRENIRYFPTMVQWVGFPRTTIDVEHNAPSGRSNYSVRKLFSLALDIVLAYSDRPIRSIITLGSIISIFSLFIAVGVLYMAIEGSFDVPGYASIMISIWFLSGLMISLIGIVGLYVGKIFEQTKNRPIYLISKSLNHD